MQVFLLVVIPSLALGTAASPGYQNSGLKKLLHNGSSSGSAGLLRSRYPSVNPRNKSDSHVNTLGWVGAF